MTLLMVHVLAAGLWLGCVLTEVFFERALAVPSTREVLAKLHYRVDLFIELPVFLIVLLTGGAMLHSAQPTPALYAMMGFGLIAILANIYCVRLVIRRRQYALAGDTASYERADHLQHKVGAVVLFGILLAMGAGLWNVA